MSELNTNNKSKDEELGSFYMGRMQPPPEPRRMLPRGLLTVLAIIAFGGVIWYAYPQGQEKYSDLDIPTISADKSTYKFKPENPGGMDVPHQDSTVFDPLEKKADDKVERLRPGTEEPIDKDAAIKAAPTEVPPPGMNARIKDNDDGTEKVVAPAAKNAKAPEAEKPAVKKTETVKTDTAKPEAAKTETAKTETAKTETTKTETTKTGAPAAAKKTASTSGVYVQLGAYKDLDAAKADWAKLQKKYPKDLGGLDIHTETVRRPSGTLERLQAGRVPEAKAKDICAAVIAGGNACIVVY